MTQELKKYHDLSFNHGIYKETSNIYGCFNCIKLYKTSILSSEDKASEGEDTYFCPCCGIDSIIFDSSCDILSIELLQKLHKFYF